VFEDGKMWASAAPCGISSCMGRRGVYVLVMVEQFGRFTMMHCVMGLTCVRLHWACR
jgi:hypothetical protein